MSLHPARQVPYWCTIAVLALALAVCAPALAQEAPPDPEVARLRAVVKVLRQETRSLRLSAERNQAVLRKELVQARKERDEWISDVEHRFFELQRYWWLTAILGASLAGVLPVCLILTAALLQCRRRTTRGQPAALAGARERLAHLKAQLGADEARLLALGRPDRGAPGE